MSHKVTISVNGVETEQGLDAGMRISTLYSIPMIASKDVTKDTISRMYFLDTSDPEGSGEGEDVKFIEKNYVKKEDFNFTKCLIK